MAVSAGDPPRRRASSLRCPKSKLKQLAAFLATGGRDLLVDIAAKAITG